MKSSLAAEAAAAIFVLSEDHWSVRRAHTPSIEKIAAVAAMVRRLLPACEVTWEAMGSFQQNRVRLIERRGARLHSISDGKPIPYEYQSKGTLGMRHNSVLFHHVHGGRTASSL